ncbi:MAG: hypothetical protein LBB50_01770 [Oscillospiraceae bacterium]|jgi:putative membrane fusion protein|nr:hypothetical protein [Oscillospiraceae bacterium]
MKEKKPYVSPVLPEDAHLPLAVLRLHWRKIFFAAAAVIVLVWGVAVVGDFVLTNSKRWVTAQAKYVDKQVTISANMLFVRDEIPLENNATGIVVMQAVAGERVGAARSYAVVCESGQDAEALSRQKTLEQRLAWLKDANEAQYYHALNASLLARQVTDTFVDFLKTLDSGDCAALPAQQEDFLHRATTLEAVMGSRMEFLDEIAETEQELQKLASRTKTAGFVQLLAPVSGVYYPQCDGLEGQLTPAALTALTPQGLETLRAAREAPTARTLGKLVKGFRWYAATTMTPSEAQLLREGGQYNVVFPQHSARVFRLRVESIRADSAGTQFAVVFSCDEKDDALLCLRNAKAEVTTKTVRGLSVPVRALQFLTKESGLPYTGVYIVRGGALHLREVEVLHKDKETAIVAWGNKGELTMVRGDRLTVQGHILLVERQKDGTLLLLGQGLLLTAENTHVTPAVEGGATTAVTVERGLFNETIIGGKGLEWKQSKDSLVITGSEFSYKERRGAQLKIHDAVLVKGRKPQDDTTTIQENP